MGLRGSEVVQCIKTLLAPANIALSCGPTRPPLLGAGVGIGGGGQLEEEGGRREEGRTLVPSSPAPAGGALPSFHRSATNLSEEALRRAVTLSFSGSMFLVSQALAL